MPHLNFGLNIVRSSHVRSDSCVIDGNRTDFNTVRLPLHIGPGLFARISTIFWVRVQHLQQHSAVEAGIGLARRDPIS